MYSLGSCKGKYNAGLSLRRQSAVQTFIPGICAIYFSTLRARASVKHCTTFPNDTDVPILVLEHDRLVTYFKNM
jgi:hypothetical protein